MQIRCIAIDDEPPALELIKQYVSGFPALKLVQIFDDAIVAAEFIRSNHIDLLFLDINMPDITGLELVKSLTEKPLIIFTTAYKKFAIDGFELDAIDYVLKPIEFDRFTKAVNKALDYYRYKNLEKTGAKEALFVRSEYQLVKINLDEIEFIESVEDYIKIYLTTGKPVMTLLTIKAILEKLPQNKFMRIHRSYIIPVSKISSLLGKKVKITNTELPVSDSYIDNLKAWLKNT